MHARVKSHQTSKGGGGSGTSRVAHCSGSMMCSAPARAARARRLRPCESFPTISESHHVGEALDKRSSASRSGPGVMVRTCLEPPNLAH